MDFSLILTISGILITILIYLISRKKTIGAKDERAMIANHDVISTILKRIVLENSYYKENEIEYLLQSKSREHRIKQEALLNVEEIVSELYSNIIQNDFINANNRKNIIQNLRRTYGNINEIEENIIDDYKSEIKVKKNKYAETVIALTSSVVATAIIATTIEIMQSINSTFSINNQFIITSVFIIGLITIVFISYFFRLGRSIEPKPMQTIASGIEFEKNIHNMFKKLKIDFKEIYKGHYDFEIIFKGNKILIEVKNTLVRIPHTTIRKIIKRIEYEIGENNANLGYIVSNERIPQSYRKLETDLVKIIDKNEFENLFKSAL